MTDREIAAIESRIIKFGDALSELSRHRDRTKELIRIIHQPGFTTPAEALLLRGALDAMTAQARSLAQFSDTFHKGTLGIGRRVAKGAVRTAV
jgi:hypothetical protein